jgi:hypothetical protein
MSALVFYVAIRKCSKFKSHLNLICFDLKNQKGFYFIFLAYWAQSPEHPEAGPGQLGLALPTPVQPGQP